MIGWAIDECNLTLRLRSVSKGICSCSCTANVIQGLSYGGVESEYWALADDGTRREILPKVSFEDTLLIGVGIGHSTCERAVVGEW